MNSQDRVTSVCDTLRQQKQDREDAERWRGLLALAGSTMDGSDRTVRLHQDDATRTCIIDVGNVRYYAPTPWAFNEALDLALKDLKP